MRLSKKTFKLPSITAIILIAGCSAQSSKPTETKPVETRTTAEEQPSEKTEGPEITDVNPAALEEIPKDWVHDPMSFSDDKAVLLTWNPDAGIWPPDHLFFEMKEGVSTEGVAHPEYFPDDRLCESSHDVILGPLPPYVVVRVECGSDAEKAWTTVIDEDLRMVWTGLVMTAVTDQDTGCAKVKFTEIETKGRSLILNTKETQEAVAPDAKCSTTIQQTLEKFTP